MSEILMEKKELRDYQKTIVDEVVKSKKDLIIALPTGAGKTVIANAIIPKLTEKVIFIVPRLELIKQAKNEIGDTDVIWADKTKLTGKHCIIASKDSIIKQVNETFDNCTLIFDEAHIGIRQTKKIVDQLKPSRVLGLTATPERMDGMALLKGNDFLHKYGVFDELLQKETVYSLQKKGFLAPLKYLTKPIENITEIKALGTGEELSDEQINEIFDKKMIWGDIVKSYEIYGKDRPAIGFTKTVKMAEKIAKLFNDKGYDFRVIHGEMSIKERDGLIELLKTRKIKGLINADLLTYGFDCPCVSYAFSVRHVKSRPLWFQMVGRVLRIDPGKKDAIFVDHGDSVSEFSHIECRLPIVSPYIDWRVDGTDNVKKKALKEAVKNEAKVRKFLSEIDPQPVGLIEVNTDDTWQRILRCLKNEHEKNKNQQEEIKLLKKTVEQLTAANKVANEAMEKNNRIIQNLKKERLENKHKFIDSNKTFEYVKNNYARYRVRAENVLKEKENYIKAEQNERNILEHELVMNWIREDEPELKFKFAENTLERGSNYWLKNYKKKEAKY